jgi:hypothetical protein
MIPDGSDVAFVRRSNFHMFEAPYSCLFNSRTGYNERCDRVIVERSEGGPEADARATFACSVNRVDQEAVWQEGLRTVEKDGDPLPVLLKYGFRPLFEAVCLHCSKCAYNKKGEK